MNDVAREDLIALVIAMTGMGIAAIFSRRVRLTLLELIGRYHPPVEPDEPEMYVHIEYPIIVSGGHLHPNRIGATKGND